MAPDRSCSMSAASQLAVVMGHVRHGIVVYDRDETICLINPHVSRIFGFAERAVVVGSTLSDYLSCVGQTVGWTRERTDNVLRNHRLWAERGAPHALDHHFDDGKVFEITFCPADDGAVVLTFLDVTHERQLRQATARREELTRRAGEMIDTVARISARNRAVAFNASIEAARMGDEGRGFAVVAEEVRDLSRQMSDALLDIGKVIDASLAS